MKFPSVKEVAPRVFLVTFDKAYDLAMTFVRYQEYYENPKFKDTFFKLEDLMEWYSKTHGDGSFSYPVDFNGFNLPAKKAFWVYKTLTKDKYDVITKYDKMMGEILWKLWAKYADYDFYIIGVSKETGTEDTVRHEIAHGLYTTNDNYRQRVVYSIRNEVPTRVKQKVYAALKDRGYHKDVFFDEFNAYMATGLYPSMKNTAVKRYQKLFRELFREYYNGYKRRSK